RPSAADPRIVDEHVDAARARDHVLNAPSYRGIVVDVERQRRNPQLVVLDRRYELGGGADGANGRMDLVSEPGEVTGGGKADAATASRDQHDGHGPLPIRDRAASAGPVTCCAAILCDETAKVDVGKVDGRTWRDRALLC